jgi:zinc D-Ala-D-Ala carboxypeptidase
MKKRRQNDRQPRRSFYATPVIFLLVVFVNMNTNNKFRDEMKSDIQSPIYTDYSVEPLRESEEVEMTFEESPEIIQTKDMDGYLILVNKENALEPDYSPEDLRLIQVMDASNNPNSTLYLRERAADMVEELFRAAEKDGLLLLACSGYRSYETQERLHQSYVERYGQEEANRFSARAGYSEHQTGLAVDISTNSIDGQIDVEFSNTAEGQWVKENAHVFGFIIRYPEGREEDTGYMYEPWHLRYVGIHTATIIFQNGWTFEDYFENK